jgi:aminopeptidase N
MHSANRRSHAQPPTGEAMLTPMKRAFFASLLLFFAVTLAAQTVRLGNDVVPLSQRIVLRVDPSRDDYSGSTTINVQVKKPVSSFLIHAVDLTANAITLDDVALTQAKGQDGTLQLTAPAPLSVGKHVLKIAFTNKFNRQSVGLYKVVSKGEPYLFTQLEAIDARRAFPCWDEPGFKIPYQLTVMIPAIYDAVSNTPIASESKADGTKTIAFAETKPLPSYLIALAVGQFDFTPINGMSVPGRVVSPKGQGRLAAYTAQVTPAIVAALEKYFNGKYPFEKIDLIAVPEFWAGAMENPGAITYRDTVLLLDSAGATPNQKQSVVKITAHELSHMWFGDLVTMEWWDDFWLNESFADWMGDKITDVAFPEFETGVSELDTIEAVMNLDARPATAPIRKRNASPADAIANVGIAYNKGKAVLSMFENWVGREKFRQGVLEYLKANAWGNGNESEFFGVVGKHAPKGFVPAMESFLNQPGLPLITVEQTGANEIRLTQTRFATSEAKAETWQVPVAIRYSGGTTSVLLDAPSKTVKLGVPKVTWVFPHANASGYYRWKMPLDAMTKLAEQSASVLTPAERLAFAGNLAALFRNGTIHGDAFLPLFAHLANDPDPNVLSALLGNLDLIRNAFESDATHALLSAYVRKTFGPALDRVGFEPKAGEPQTLTIVRPQLIRTLALSGDDERVWSFVRERLPKYLADPSTLHPTIAATVIALGAVHGDEALFNEYQRRFEAATNPGERTRYIAALGRFTDPQLRNRALEYGLTDAVRANELFTLWGANSFATAQQRDAFFDWFTAHFDAIIKRLPPMFAGGLASIANGCEPERVTKMREFYAGRHIEGAERSLARVTEAVSECAALREREMEAVMRALR